MPQTLYIQVLQGFPSTMRHYMKTHQLVFKIINFNERKKNYKLDEDDHIA